MKSDRSSRHSFLNQLATTLSVAAFLGAGFGQTPESHSNGCNPDSCFDGLEVAHDSAGNPVMLTTAHLYRMAVNRVVPNLPGGFGRIEGTVRIKVLVDAYGAVKCVADVSGHPLLASISVGAARQWRFRPYQQNGKRTPVLGFLDFRFSTSSPRKVQIDHSHRADSDAPITTTISELMKRKLSTTLRHLPA